MIAALFRRKGPEPMEHGPFDGPIIMGKFPAALTPNTLRIIRRHAGKMPAIKLAQALCWSMRRLENVARTHRIPLYCPQHLAREPEPRGA